MPIDPIPAAPAPDPNPPSPAEQLKNDPKAFYAGLPDSAVPPEHRSTAQPEPEATPDEGADPPADNTPPPDEKPIVLPKDLTEAKASVTSAWEKMASGQELDKAQLKALEVLGIDEAKLNQIKTAFQANGELRDQKVHALAGGKEKYSAMIQWAAEALPQGQKDAFNKAVSSGDQGQIEFAVAALSAQYTAKNPPKGVKVDGKASNGSSSAFTTREEVKKAMRDPRYGKDAAYTQSVGARIAVSPASVI
jgi:hypothetical protein